MSQDTAYGFEQALGWLRGGRKIVRRGWNGQGMFIYLIAGLEQEVGEDYNTYPLRSVLGEGRSIKRQDRIDMKFAGGEIGIWSPSHEDLLAKDWNVLT